MTHEYLRGVDTINYQGGMKDETVMFDPIKFQDLHDSHPDSPFDLTVSALTCIDEGPKFESQQGLFFFFFSSSFHFVLYLAVFRFRYEINSSGYVRFHLIICLNINLNWVSQKCHTQ